MTRPILRSLCLTTGIFITAAQVFAVWPPSTSLVFKSEVSSTGPQAERLPPALHHDVQEVTSKLGQDERRLDKVIQDLKDDEAALKQLSEEGVTRR